MPQFEPQFTTRGLGDFTRGYVEAAEWLLSESDDNGPYEEGVGSSANASLSKLRNGIGEDGLASLRDACQDY